MPVTKRKRRPTVAEDGPRPVDVHVGSRVRLRRNLLGMSQETLGDALGLTFQQVQKYERGVNRIGASRLHQLSRILDVPVSFFFDDMSEQVRQAEPEERIPTEPLESNVLYQRETQKLIRAYYKIKDENTRKHLLSLIVSLSGDAS